MFHLLHKTSSDFLVAHPSIKMQYNDVHIFKIPAVAKRENLMVNPEVDLSADEISQSEKIRLPAMKENFIRSRVYLRSILASFLDVAPAELKFHLKKGKKPFLKGLEYNISRSAELIVIAVSRHPVGIDLEYIKPDFDYQAICKQHFHQEEQTWIDGDLSRFFTIWTRKEAVLKFTGEGLTDDMTAFSTMHPNLQRAGEALELNSYLILNHYVMSLATPDSGRKAYFWAC